MEALVGEPYPCTGKALSLTLGVAPMAATLTHTAASGAADDVVGGASATTPSPAAVSRTSALQLLAQLRAGFVHGSPAAPSCVAAGLAEACADANTTSSRWGRSNRLRNVPTRHIHALRRVLDVIVFHNAHTPEVRGRGWRLVVSHRVVLCARLCLCSTRLIFHWTFRVSCRFSHLLWECACPPPPPPSPMQPHFINAECRGP